MFATQRGQRVGDGGRVHPDHASTTIRFIDALGLMNLFPVIVENWFMVETLFFGKSLME